MAYSVQAIIAFVAVISISATALNAAEYKQVTEKAEFASVAVDKKLVANWGWLRAGSDGRVTGVTDGDKINGAWEWKGRYFCRTITFGSTRRSGCISVHVSGDNLVFILDQGKGHQVPMKIR